MGLKGVIVETHPLFWILLSISAVYALKIRKKEFYSSLVLIFFIGLSLRLIPATQSFYPSYDPWNELASVHHIQAFGFDLRGNYYHSSLPVLQVLLIALTPVFGEYNTLAFFGPVFGWTLAFICLYKLSREFFSSESILLVLLLYSSANIAFQSFTTPETIALSVGFATIYFFHRNIVEPSYKYTLATVAVFTLLNFTHHLTAFCVIIVTGAIAIVLVFKKKRNTNLFVWLSMLWIFLVYWELYQHMLSNMLIFQIERPLIGIPTGWPKPIWWWIIYLLPKVFLASMLIAWVFPFMMRKTMPNPAEIFSATIVGGLTFIFGFMIPRVLIPLRILNQFGGYFSMGVANLKYSNILIKVLTATFIIGLLAEFPMTNMSNFYVGGYWINHSPQEISALQYLATNATPGSNIVIDARCQRVLNCFAAPDKNLTTIADWRAFEVYNLTSPEDKWIYCVKNGLNYIFVSNFYKVIAHFDVYGGAEKFSDDQLSQFSAPYFNLLYEKSEVTIYLVNIHL